MAHVGSSDNDRPPSHTDGSEPGVEPVLAESATETAPLPAESCLNISKPSSPAKTDEGITTTETSATDTPTTDSTQNPSAAKDSSPADVIKTLPSTSPSTSDIPPPPPPPPMPPAPPNPPTSPFSSRRSITLMKSAAVGKASTPLTPVPTPSSLDNDFNTKRNTSSELADAPSFPPDSKENSSVQTPEIPVDPTVVQVTQNPDPSSEQNGDALVRSGSAVQVPAAAVNSTDSQLKGGNSHGAFPASDLPKHSTLPIRQSAPIDDVNELPSVTRRPMDHSLKRKAPDADSNVPADSSETGDPDDDSPRPLKRRSIGSTSVSADPQNDSGAGAQDQDSMNAGKVYTGSEDPHQNMFKKEVKVEGSELPSELSTAKITPSPESVQESGKNSAHSHLKPTDENNHEISGGVRGASAEESSYVEANSDGSPKETSNNGVLSPERPLPRNLPKSAKHRPENARVFIGNLASEYTDIHDIIKIFHKYGTLIEEPVLRRSFGFVQYSTAEAAKAAVDGEQGRIIGGIGIDLSIADNREVRKGTHIMNNTPFQHPRAGPGTAGRSGRRERENPAFTARKRRRSVSPQGPPRKGGVHPPQFRRQRPEPRNGVYLRILCMSPTAKAYARHCENTFRNMTGLRADVLHIIAAGLGEALGRAMRDSIPYVMVVASKDVEDGTCTIRTLEKTGYEKSGRGNGVIPLKEAVEVCLIERGILMPMNPASQNMAGAAAGGDGLGPGGHRGGVPGGQMYPGRGPISGTAQWLQGAGGSGETGMDGKPGWMSDSRGTHAPNIRMPAPPGGMGMTGMGMAGPGNTGMMGSGAHGGYGGMDGGGPLSYGHGGMGIGPSMGSGGVGGPGAPGMVGANIRSDGYDGTNTMGATYGGGMGSAGMEYGRNFGTSAYSMGVGSGGPQGGAGYGERYSGPGSNVRSRGYGGGHEGEYDPASVNGSMRGGGYGEWGRDQSDMSGSEVYGAGGMMHGVAGNRGQETGMYGMGTGGQGYRPAGGYGAGVGQGYDTNRGGTHMDNVQGGGIYAGGMGVDIGNSQAFDSRRMYGYDGYDNGVGGYRNNDMNMAHGRMDQAQVQRQDVQRFPSGQPGSGAPVQGQVGSYADGPGRYNAMGGMDMYTSRDTMGGDGNSGLASSGYSGGRHNDTRRLSGRNGGTNGSGSGGGGGGGTVDIDNLKLSNLITAFTQKQQAQGQAPQTHQRQGHAHAHSGHLASQTNEHQVQPHERDFRRGREAGTASGASVGVGANTGTRLIAGGVSQILADPAVQQAIQNIGGAGRVGAGLNAPGMPLGMWQRQPQSQQLQQQQPQHQQPSSMRGPGPSRAQRPGSVNPGPHRDSQLGHMAPPNQNYYG